MRFLLLLVAAAACGAVAGLGLFCSDRVAESVESFSVYANACLNTLVLACVAFVGYAVTL